MQKRSLKLHIFNKSRTQFFILHVSHGQAPEATQITELKRPRRNISNNGAPIHQPSLTTALAATADHREVTCGLALPGRCQRGHRVDTQLGFEGKMTNGAEKLSSKPILMSVFSPSSKSRQALNGRKKRKEAGRHTFHPFFL